MPTTFVRLPSSPVRASPPARAWRRLLEGDRRLAVFGLVLLAAALPLALAAGLDDRTLRGVNVWVKPLKFALSIALFAWTSAWFAGLLPAAVRRGRAAGVLAWTLVAAATFEIVYIGLQAARGEASHFNTDDALHGALYTLMGAAALAMTATQAGYAWLITRHAAPGRWRDAVVTGLVLSFVLGTTAGFLLGGLQPPAGSGLPLLGWHATGDLRPAHFIGLHAHQALPLAVLWLGPRALKPAALAWGAAWALALAAGLVR